MLSPDLRRKLSKFNLERNETETLEYHITPLATTLESVIPGRVHVHEYGELYIVERSAGDFGILPQEELISRLTVLTTLGYTPEEALFLDIETCGIASRPLFLIGIMRVCDGELKIEQFFARNYAEEKSILAHAADTIAKHKMLATFNGKAYDIPYIRDRMLYHKLEAKFDVEHLDLLHHARRKWRRILPNCQLKTLEENICGRRRFGDIPSEIIPELYHAFVRTGNAEPIEIIFRHNALDLIAMAELLPHIGL